MSQLFLRISLTTLLAKKNIVEITKLNPNCISILTSLQHRHVITRYENIKIFDSVNNYFMTQDPTFCDANKDVNDNQNIHKEVHT